MIGRKMTIILISALCIKRQIGGTKRTILCSGITLFDILVTKENARR